MTNDIEHNISMELLSKQLMPSQSVVLKKENTVHATEDTLVESLPPGRVCELVNEAMVTG